MRRTGSRDLGFYITMVGPAVLVFLMIVAFPIVWAIFLGFMNYNVVRPQDATFIGFGHYLKMFADPVFQRAFVNNMAVVAISLFGQIPIGFVLAYIIYRKMVKAEAFFQSMVFLPNFLASIVVGTLWKRIFASPGPAESLLRMITGDSRAMITWGLDPSTAMIPIGIVLIWMYTGLYMVIFLANLQKIDKEMIEAAQIDGASEPKIFTRIVVPMLSGVILVNAILAISGSLKGFDLIWAMTGGGPANNSIILPIYMYKYSFAAGPSQFGFGAAVSNTMVAISLGLIALSNLASKWLNRKGEY